MKTPEEWAAEWERQCAARSLSDYPSITRDIIGEAQAEAVAGERERCARVCEEIRDYSSSFNDRHVLHLAAQKIRDVDSAAEREAPNPDFGVAQQATLETEFDERNPNKPRPVPVPEDG